MDLWWERDDLSYNSKGEIVFAGRAARDKAEKLKTPLFLYSARRITENIKRLNAALDEAVGRSRIFYALKANRFAPLLTYIKTSTACGVDVCSPTEVRHALSCGFEEEDISYTGTSVSNADLDFLLGLPGLMLNCDGLSMIRRVGKRSPGRKIGIRINPAMGTGYGSNELLRYSGEKPTKFGIYASEFEDAVALARKYDLEIERVHFHTGCGYLNDQLPVWKTVLQECLRMIEALSTVRTVNLGGGLGVPLSSQDEPLDLSAWSNILGSVLGEKSYAIHVEPGTFLVKDAGLVILEANTVETKAGRHFVGVNGGFNLAMEPAHYKLPCEPVPCRLHGAKETIFAKDVLRPTTFAGNINEALDLWIEDLPFPEIAEGELIAFINAGAYTQSMSSNHCMRGRFSELLLL